MTSRTPFRSGIGDSAGTLTVPIASDYRVGPGLASAFDTGRAGSVDADGAIALVRSGEPDVSATRVARTTTAAEPRTEFGTTASGAVEPSLEAFENA